MALGVLVIASDYSGNLEFMNKENSLLVPTKVIETERSYGPYPSGTRWGEPDIESAVAALRNTLNNEFRSYIAEVGSKSVRISLDSKILALKAKEFIDNILSE
jgi:glycosyltransferase involved in cell wall biosynthesis